LRTCSRKASIKSLIRPSRVNDPWSPISGQAEQWKFSGCGSLKVRTGSFAIPSVYGALAGGQPLWKTKLHHYQAFGLFRVLPDDGDILRRRNVVARFPVVIGFPTSSRTRPLANGLRDNSLLPPFGQFRLCLEPVIQIVSVFFSALFEKFVCTELDCLFQFSPNLVLRRCFSRGGGLSASIHGVFLHSARGSCIRHYPSSRRA